MMRRKFVVLDRDGTIIVERNYLSDPRQIQLLNGAAEGLRELSRMGLCLIIITNQSAIGRGIVDRERLDTIHRRMCDLLANEGVSIDGIYYCPHLPEDNCSCRKPETGLLELATEEMELDPHSGFVIGDQPCDIELGRRAGATTFLVRTGYGARTDAEGTVKPDYTVGGLPDAARIIRRLIE